MHEVSLVAELIEVDYELLPPGFAESNGDSIAIDEHRRMEEGRAEQRMPANRGRAVDRSLLLRGRSRGRRPVSAALLLALATPVAEASTRLRVTTTSLPPATAVSKRKISNAGSGTIESGIAPSAAVGSSGSTRPVAAAAPVVRPCADGSSQKMMA